MKQQIYMPSTHIQKHDIEANWIKATNFTPAQGQMIVYDSEIGENDLILELPEGRTVPYSYARFKIGDGTNTINDLPFANSPESVGLVTNEANALVQESNQAYGEYSVSLGNNNINLSENSVTEGLLNISGVMFNESVDCSVISSELTEEGTAAITIENLAENALNIEDHIVIFADDYWFSCKVDNIENFDTYSILTVINHNVSKPINETADKATIKIYKVADNNVADSCHTEHVEGAYNISAASGDGATSSRVSHIEGHTNISFGQYNHIEGVRNKALDQTEMTHIEGRFNTVQTEKNVSDHVEGEYNTIDNSSYTHVGGYNNKVNKSTRSFVRGYSNKVTDSSDAVVMGRSNTVTEAKKSIVLGEGLENIKESQVVLGKFNNESADAAFIVANGQDTKNRDNIFEIHKDGSLKYKNEANELVSLNDVHASINKDIQELKFKQSTSLEIAEGFNTIYLADPYDYKYIAAEDVNSIELVSKNELNNIYIYGSTSSGTKQLCGLDFINDEGKVTISGSYKAGSGWPQYYFHRSDKNRLELNPGEKYFIGLMYEPSEARRVTLKLSYKDSGNFNSTTDRSTKETPIEVEWTDFSELVSLYIQTSQSDYIEPLTVYPYIVSSRWIRDFNEWVPYKKVVYNDPKSIIEIDESANGYIRGDSSGKIIFYDKLNLATTDYVDNKINKIDLSEYATKKYVDDSIANINIDLPDNIATEEYVDNAIANIDIPSMEGFATEKYVDDAIKPIQESINDINKELELIDFEDPELITVESSLNPKGAYTAFAYKFEDGVDAISVSETSNVNQILTYNSRNILNSYYISQSYQAKVGSQESGLIWTSKKDEGIINLSGVPAATHWPQFPMFRNNSNAERLNLCPGVEYTFGVFCPDTLIMNIKLDYYEYNEDGTSKKITLSTARNKGTDSFSILWKDNYAFEQLFLQGNKDTSYDNLLIYPYMSIDGPIESLDEWDIYSVTDNKLNTGLIYSDNRMLAMNLTDTSTKGSANILAYKNKETASKEDLDKVEKDTNIRLEDLETASLEKFSVTNSGNSITIPDNVSKHAKIRKIEGLTRNEPEDVYLRFTDFKPTEDWINNWISENNEGFIEFDIYPMTSYYYEPLSLEAGDYHISFEVISGLEYLGNLWIDITSIDQSNWYSSWSASDGSQSIHLPEDFQLHMCAVGQGDPDLYGKVIFKFYITKGYSAPTYVNKDAKISSIESYKESTLVDSIDIPESVQKIDGYGRSGSMLEWLEDKSVKLTITKYANLNDLDYPTTYDVTKDFKESNLLNIESATEIKFISEYNLPISTEVEYSRNILYSIIDKNLNTKVDKINKEYIIYGTGYRNTNTSYSLDYSNRCVASSIPRRDYKGDIIIPEIPSSDNAATSRKYVAGEINNINAITSDIESRVSNLENLTLSYPEITSTDYEKIVPDDVGEPARIKMIGGATEKVVVSKNIFNPKDLPNTEWLKDVTYNSDGSISFTIPVDETTISANFDMFPEMLGFPTGKYYVYTSIGDLNIWGTQINIEIHCKHVSGSGYVDTPVTLKLMIWKYGDSDDYEIAEAPSDTVFEPYILDFRHAEVSKVDSIGADGNTLIDSITIPEVVRNKEGYGRSGSYITFVDNTVTLTVTKDENLAELTRPIITDISDLFIEGNKLQVQQGGVIRFVNEHEMPVPNTVGFIKRKE